MLKISHFILGAIGIVLAILGGLSQMIPNNSKIAHIDSVATSAAVTIAIVAQTVATIQTTPSTPVDTVAIQQMTPIR
jgi:hypothetical protein